MLPNLPQTFIAFWGVMKAGAVAVMTNPLYMESELTHQIKDSGAKHLITLDIFWPKNRGSAGTARTGRLLCDACP